MVRAIGVVMCYVSEGPHKYRHTKMCVCVCVCVCECVFLTQQRWQPVDVGLAVRVQEGDDFSFSEAGSQQACPDQPLPLLGPQDANLRKPHHVLLQRCLQVLCRESDIISTNRPGLQKIQRINQQRRDVQSH